jgi:hypothetical protein
LAGEPDSFRSPGRPCYRGLLIPGAVWSPDGQRLASRFTVLPVDPLDRPEGTVEQTKCVAGAVTTAHLLDDVITRSSVAPHDRGRPPVDHTQI